MSTSHGDSLPFPHHLEPLDASEPSNTLFVDYNGLGPTQVMAHSRGSGLTPRVATDRSDYACGAMPRGADRFGVFTLTNGLGAAMVLCYEPGNFVPEIGGWLNGIGNIERYVGVSNGHAA